MRIHHLVLLLPLCALPLNAQPSSDDLYFPPEISVGVSQDFSTEMRLTHQAYRDDALRRLKFGDHLERIDEYRDDEPVAEQRWVT